MRILVVDDEPEARELLRRLFVRAGADASVAATVEQAIEEVSHRPPDLLVSDISMPIDDGYSLMQQLRASGLSIPAVAVTANAGSEDRQSALAAGFDAHLPKPIDTDALLTTLAGLARSRRRDH